MFLPVCTGKIAPVPVLQLFPSPLTSGHSADAYVSYLCPIVKIIVDHSSPEAARVLEAKAAFLAWSMVPDEALPP